jgi:hypothetical protein
MIKDKYDTHGDFGLALMTLTWKHKIKGRKSPHDTQNLSQFMKKWLIVHQQL